MVRIECESAKGVVFSAVASPISGSRFSKETGFAPIHRASFFVRIIRRNSDILLKYSSTFREVEREVFDPSKIRVVSSGYWLILTLWSLTKIPLIRPCHKAAILPRGPKKLCFTSLSLIPMVSIARLSVLKQSSFGLLGQYDRRVTRVSYEWFTTRLV